MFTKTNLGGEESEQSLPSWISDHLGAKSYIDETSQSPSSHHQTLQRWIPRVLPKRVPCTPSAPYPIRGSFTSRRGLDKNLFRGSPSNVKGWKTRFFFASGDEWEFPSGTAASEYSASSQILGNARSVVPNNFLLFATYYRLSDMRFSGKSCNKRCRTLSEVDAKRTEEVLREDRARRLLRGVEGPGFADLQETFCDLVARRSLPAAETTRPRGIGRAIRRAFPGVPDETLLRWLGGKLCRLELVPPPWVKKQGVRLRPRRLTNATKAKPPTKGVVIREKRTREGVPVIETGEPESSKGKEAAPLLPPKKFKSIRGAINARRRAAEAGTSSLVVMFASSLALRSQEHLHDIDFHMARADSAELDEERSKPGTEVDDLKATVAELTNKLAKAKELAIEDFKALGEFKAAVTDSAATYFSDGFEFCKRQLLHQYPNLGVNVANMAMDPIFCRGRGGDERKEKILLQGVAPNV
ncbi:hypothetical protein Acr_01g0008070 [Actinidia rufa]|uniref:Uncharacterized protein n=1 Tax=Actinidia rufa TaxID=165716 RepID=A0A7J0E3H5_9ERIC|nr:hypothetical protein Acr_01g0008070 [Actinidia rufa]